jgi:hypothetical protein
MGRILRITHRYSKNTKTIRTVTGLLCFPLFFTFIKRVCKGVHVVPFPLFWVLDGKDSGDYIQTSLVVC